MLENQERGYVTSAGKKKRKGPWEIVDPQWTLHVVMVVEYDPLNRP
jgi:hypothetical protein